MGFRIPVISFPGQETVSVGFNFDPLATANPGDSILIPSPPPTQGILNPLDTGSWPGTRIKGIQFGSLPTPRDSESP